MDNSNIWDWDNGDARRISSVYTEAEDADTAPANMDSSEDISEHVTEHAFILVDEPKDESQNEPQNESSYTQPEFQPIVPVKTMQQNQAEENRETNQSKGTAYSSNYNAGYSREDISENKVVAMAAYLLGPIGIIIALLAARDSAYTAFHVRQALKLTVSSAVLEIAAAVFALFGMVPLVGIIFQLVLAVIGIAWLAVLVLRLAAIAQVGDGEAKEPAFIRNLSFFK